MSKQIDASLVVEEGIEIQAVDLYLRPVYAFVVRWATKGRTGIIECDALTTEVSMGGKTYEGYVSEPLDPAALFDVTADDVAEIIPGGRVFIAPVPSAPPEVEAAEWEEEEPEGEAEPDEDLDSDLTRDVS
jgi:hypothetical protein